MPELAALHLVLLHLVLVDSATVDVALLGAALLVALSAFYLVFGDGIHDTKVLLGRVSMWWRARRLPQSQHPSQSSSRRR